jgi:hypothetical protein
MTGNWPAITVDHKNGKRDDNRWNNLREATWNQQNVYTKRRAGVSTPLRGVCKITNSESWSARIKHNGKFFYLGSFSTAEEAHEAYRQASKRLRGEFHFEYLERANGTIQV